MDGAERTAAASEPATPDAVPDANADNSTVAVGISTPASGSPPASAAPREAINKAKEESRPPSVDDVSIAAATADSILAVVPAARPAPPIRICSCAGGDNCHRATAHIPKECGRKCFERHLRCPACRWSARGSKRPAKGSNRAQQVAFNPYALAVPSDSYGHVGMQYVPHAMYGYPPSYPMLGPMGQVFPPNILPYPQQPYGMPSPQAVPPQGMPPHGMSPHGMPPHGMASQGVPPQGMPTQGMPPQGMPPQGMPPHVMPVSTAHPSFFAGPPLTEFMGGFGGLPQFGDLRDAMSKRPRVSSGTVSSASSNCHDRDGGSHEEIYSEPSGLGGLREVQHAVRDGSGQASFHFERHLGDRGRVLSGERKPNVYNGTPWFNETLVGGVTDGQTFDGAWRQHSSMYSDPRLFGWAPPHSQFSGGSMNLPPLTPRYVKQEEGDGISHSRLQTPLGMVSAANAIEDGERRTSGSSSVTFEEIVDGRGAWRTGAGDKITSVKLGNTSIDATHEQRHKNATVGPLNHSAAVGPPLSEPTQVGPGPDFSSKSNELNGATLGDIMPSLVSLRDEGHQVQRHGHREYQETQPQQQQQHRAEDHQQIYQDSKRDDSNNSR